MPTTTLAPPNSLLLVMDHTAGQIPESMRGSAIAFTSTCIAIGTLSETAGSTRVALDNASSAQPNGTIAFDGVLDTPSRTLAACGERVGDAAATTHGGNHATRQPRVA